MVGVAWLFYKMIFDYMKKYRLHLNPKDTKGNKGKDAKNLDSKISKNYDKENEEDEN